MSGLKSRPALFYLICVFVLLRSFSSDLTSLLSASRAIYYTINPISHRLTTLPSPRVSLLAIHQDM